MAAPVAVVTGAAGGVGSHLCACLLQRGWQVAGWDVQSSPALRALQDTFETAFSVVLVDLRSTEQVTTAAEVFLAAHPALALLVNAAAVLPPESEQPLEHFPVDGALNVFDINALGPLRVAKALLPGLEQAKGKVLNVSSEAGSLATHAGYTNRYDYCMSKAALNIQSLILRRYLQARGVRVALVHPGWVRTSMGGSDAPLNPEDSAAALCRLAVDAWPQEPFVDYDGTPRAW